MRWCTSEKAPRFLAALHAVGQFWKDSQRASPNRRRRDRLQSERRFDERTFHLLGPAGLRRVLRPAQPVSLSPAVSSLSMGDDGVMDVDGVLQIPEHAVGV